MASFEFFKAHCSCTHSSDRHQRLWPLASAVTGGGQIKQWSRWRGEEVEKEVNKKGTGAGGRAEPGFLQVISPCSDLECLPQDNRSACQGRHRVGKWAQRWPKHISGGFMLPKALTFQPFFCPTQHAIKQQSKHWQCLFDKLHIFAPVVLFLYLLHGFSSLHHTRLIFNMRIQNDTGLKQI